MATIPQILQHIYPGNEWTIQEDDYATLWWSPNNTPSVKPTEAEIRANSDAADILVAAMERQGRQQRAMADAPDYLLTAIDILIQGMVEIRRVVNDIRNTATAGSHTGSYTSWDNDVVTKIGALRQKVQDLRDIP
jgi:hypothetical protein